MTEKYVDELYGKFSKHIAKKRRIEFKSALEECGNGKYESLKEFEPKKKAPFSNITYLMAWVSTLLGCIFLVISLFVFSLIVPLTAENKQFAGKFGGDMKNYAELATNELETGYSEVAAEHLYENIITVYQATLNSEYEQLDQNVKNFDEAYKNYNDSLKQFFEANEGKVDNEDNEDNKATAEQQLIDAEEDFNSSVKSILVAKGIEVDFDAELSAYKTSLATYLEELKTYDDAIENLKNEELEKEEYDKRKDELDNGIKKAWNKHVLDKEKFDNIIFDVSEYISNAKYLIALKKDFDNKKTYVLEQSISYFDEKNGAIKNLSTYYNNYLAATKNYDAYLTKYKQVDNVAEHMSLNYTSKYVYTVYQLVECQNDLVAHFEMYQSVINSMPKRLEEITEYYNTINEAEYYDDGSEKPRVQDFFRSYLNTRAGVLSRTDFKVCKDAYNARVKGFEEFKFVYDISKGVLSDEYKQSLDSVAADIQAHFENFSSCTSNMETLSTQVFYMASENQIQIDIVSTIMMFFDIILAVILFIYWLGVVLIHRSRAQEENFKSLNEIIKN